LNAEKRDTDYLSQIRHIESVYYVIMFAAKIVYYDITGQSLFLGIFHGKKV
jgi:hypothetical protein